MNRTVFRTQYAYGWDGQERVEQPPTHRTCRVRHYWGTWHLRRAHLGRLKAAPTRISGSTGATPGAWPYVLFSFRLLEGMRKLAKATQHGSPWITMGHGVTKCTGLKDRMGARLVARPLLKPSD